MSIFGSKLAPKGDVMNLIINVNENLYSIKSVADGEKKLQAAIDEALYNIKQQVKENFERGKEGKSPLPYNTVVKDEYGKDLVTVKETKSLLEIRNNYNKQLEKLPYPKREENLLAAMGEIGNSEKNDRIFRDELANQLNQVLFVSDVKLSPGLEKILDYFGDTKGVFSTINFKEDITVKCIKDLINLPNPDTGKPPKTFEQLMSNIISVNEVFKENENRSKYIDIARSYINVSYKNIIPHQYREIFSERGGLENFIKNHERKSQENQKVEEKEFVVSEKNFKKMFQVFSELAPFKEKPFSTITYLMNHVPEEKRANVQEWLTKQGCKDEISTVKTLTKWLDEAKQEAKQEKKNPRQNDFSRGN